jgi:hypothetical protein
MSYFTGVAWIAATVISSPEQVKIHAPPTIEIVSGTPFTSCYKLNYNRLTKAKTRQIVAVPRRQVKSKSVPSLQYRTKMLGL